MDSRLVPILLFLGIFLDGCALWSPDRKILNLNYLDVKRKISAERRPLVLYVDINEDTEADMIEWFGVTNRRANHHRAFFVKGENKKLADIFDLYHPRSWKIIMKKHDLRDITNLTSYELEVLKNYHRTRRDAASRSNMRRTEYQFIAPLL